MNELFLGQNAKIKEIETVRNHLAHGRKQNFFNQVFYKSKNVPEIEKFRKNFKNNFFLRLGRKPIATGVSLHQIKKCLFNEFKTDKKH